MKKINLSGEIGWGIHPFMVGEEFEEAAGDDIEMTMATPGGDVFLGAEINEIISNYKREFPKAQIILNVLEAVSMGSHIMTNPAIDLVLVKDESVVMIHNPISGVYGDYRDLLKMADFLDRYAGVMAISYTKKLKNKIKETRAIMDEETWFIGGKEIIKAGFADGFMDGKKSSTKDIKSIHAESELRFKAVKKKVQATIVEQGNFEKIAAITKEFKNSVDNNTVDNSIALSDTPAPGGNNNLEDVKLDNIKDLEKEHPGLYAEAIEAGKTQGINDEKDRVKSLLEMKNKKDYEGIELIHNRIDEGISNGESMEDIKLAIGALLFKNDVAAAADTNAIGDIDTLESDTVSGEIKKEDDNRSVF